MNLEEKIQELIYNKMESKTKGILLNVISLETSEEAAKEIMELIKKKRRINRRYSI